LKKILNLIKKYLINQILIILKNQKIFKIQINNELKIFNLTYQINNKCNCINKNKN